MVIFRSFIGGMEVGVRQAGVGGGGKKNSDVIERVHSDQFGCRFAEL